MNSEEEQGSQKQVKHRRKKNEIEKEFICGDHNCGRKYGTNAALYTHIKNKHGGVPPQGTVKPSAIKKLRDSPELNLQDEEMSRTVEILQDPDYMKFALMISDLGEFGNKNIILRDPSETFSVLEEDKIQELYSQILIGASKLSNDVDSSKILTKRAEQFLKQSSAFWKKTNLNELYTILIYSYIYKGERFDMILEDINKNQLKYKLFSELVGQQKIQSLKEAYTTLWNFMS